MAGYSTCSKHLLLQNTFNPLPEFTYYLAAIPSFLDGSSLFDNWILPGRQH
jgi:hypothetical protein